MRRGLFAVVALVACGDAGAKGAPPAPTATAAASMAHGQASAPAARSAAAATPADHVDLLRFKITSGVEGKEPTDTLTTAAAGQRVYAHAAIRNRTGAARRVSLRFLVDKEERTTVDLRVDPSWSWRTWGYVTLRAGDEMATLTVELHDDRGELLAERTLPVRDKAVAAPN